MINLLELVVVTLPASQMPNWSALAGKFDESYMDFLGQQLDGSGLG